MKKLINKAITLAKAGDNQEELLVTLRQLRTKINEPAKVDKNLSELPSISLGILNLGDMRFETIDLVKRVMDNMKRPPKGHNQVMRWALVRDTFGVGSTAACAMCHYFGLNPDDVIR